VLTLRADCSLVTLKPAYLSPYLPIFTVIEDFCCGRCAMIPGPSPDLRIQLPNELALRPVPMEMYHLSQFYKMSFHRLFTGSDECLEAKRWSIVARFSRMGLTYRKLPHGPTEKIKTHRALVLPKRVGNARFAWFQFESDVFEPCF